MERLPAPRGLAGAAGAISNRIEGIKSLDPSGAGIDIAAEVITHQCVHRGFLPQGCFPRLPQKSVIEAEGEVCHRHGFERNLILTIKSVLHRTRAYELTGSTCSNPAQAAPTRAAVPITFSTLQRSRS